MTDTKRRWTMFGDFHFERDEALTVTCGCGATATAGLQLATHQVSTMRWCRPPEGWWVFVGDGPPIFGAPGPVFSCPSCIKLTEPPPHDPESPADDAGFKVALRLSDEVQAKAAQLAAQEGLSLDEFIAQTVEAKLSSPASLPTDPLSKASSADAPDREDVRRAEVPVMVSRILDRPARWAPSGSLLSAYEGSDRTLQVFNTSPIDQVRFLEILEPHRPELERCAGGPIVFIFHTREQHRRLDLRERGAMPDPTKPIPESEVDALFQHRDTWDKPGGKESP